MLSGKLVAKVDGQTKAVGDGDIIEVPRGSSYRLQVQSPFARYVLVCSTPYLEQRIDSMTPAEAEKARLHMKPN
jgi:quercetin dioxygenase-like cupin family protein